MHFCHLARDRDTRVRRDCREVGEKIADAKRAFVDDEGAAARKKVGELPPARAAFLFREADERELACWQSRRDKGGDRRSRAGHRHNLVSRGNSRGDELLARIGEAGGSGVGHERDVPAALKLADELGRFAPVIELGIARQVLRPDLVLAQEDLRVPRVLARDHVDLLQDPKGAQRDILEVADRSRDEVELAYGPTITRRPSRRGPS